MIKGVRTMKCNLNIQGAFWVITSESGASSLVPIQGESSKPIANAVLQAEQLVRKLSELGVREIVLGSDDSNGISQAEWVFLVPKGNPAFEEARQRALKVATELGVDLKSVHPIKPLEQLTLI
jgi:hypothetical protein